MTDEPADVTKARYLIWKRGAFYRPNSQGYTTSAIQAGRYTLDDANSITHPNGPDGPRDGMGYAHEDEVVDADWQAYQALAAALAEQTQRAVAAEAEADSWENRALHQNDVANNALARVAELTAKVKLMDELDAINVDAVAELTAKLEAAEEREADLKSSVVAFCGPWAAEYAKARGLAPGELHPTHYDILKDAGARMDDFRRAALIGGE